MEDFRLKIFNSIFQLAGTYIATQLEPKTDEQLRKNYNRYYNKVLKLVEENPVDDFSENQMNTLEKSIEKNIQPLVEKLSKTAQEHISMQPGEYYDEHEEQEEIEQDMTEEKIEKGTACLACSRDHLSTSSAVLNEALRFARKDGVGTEDVQDRLGIALDELNAMERIDLAAKNVTKLRGKERDIAERAINESRELRHKITSIGSVNELEEVAAHAAEVRTDFMKEVFSLSKSDGTIDKLCDGMSGRDKQKCIDALSKAIEK